MTKKDVDAFEKLQVQLEGLHSEISALSKKSQNDALNKFKLKFVNQILSEANVLLGTAYKPFDDFELFDEVQLPTTSDVAMMLTQYLGCFENLKIDNVKYHINKYCWLIDEKLSDSYTSRPKRM